MQEYKRESFEMFEQLLDRIQHETVRILARVQVRAEEDVEAVEEQRRSDAAMEFQHAEAGGMAAAAAGQGAAAPAPAMAGAASATPAGAAPQGAAGEAPATFVRDGRKIGRNEPCPCGSGKKYKQCHGKLS
jgi:preprotein translocase subunit SecA